MGVNSALDTTARRRPQVMMTRIGGNTVREDVLLD